MAIPEKLMCVSCSRPAPRKDFYLNYNDVHKEYNFGRMYHCKDCCKKISQSIMEKYWSSSKNKDDKIAYSLGIRAICSFFHMPYLNEVMDKVRDLEINSTRDRDWNYVFQYTNALEEMEIPKEYWEDLSGNTFLPMDLLKVAKPTSDGDRALFEELNKDWGNQDCIEDYLFLEEKFESYTKGETLTPTMVNMVRYLCQAELDVIKLKRAKAELKDINTAEKRVTDYYSKLKLDDFKFNKAKSDQEKLIETWASIHENIEPLDWEDDNLKDRLGFDRDYDNIMRSLGNKVTNSKDYPTLTLEDVQNEKAPKKRKK